MWHVLCAQFGLSKTSAPSYVRGTCDIWGIYCIPALQHYTQFTAKGHYVPVNPLLIDIHTNNTTSGKQNGSPRQRGKEIIIFHLLKWVQNSPKSFQCSLLWLMDWVNKNREEKIHIKLPSGIVWQALYKLQRPLTVSSTYPLSFCKFTSNRTLSVSTLEEVQRKLISYGFVWFVMTP